MSSEDRLVAEVQILEAAVFVVTDALDNLVEACLDTNGHPVVPDQKAIMRARSMLPVRCLHTLKK